MFTALFPRENELSSCFKSFLVQSVLVHGSILQSLLLQDLIRQSYVSRHAFKCVCIHTTKQHTKQLGRDQRTHILKPCFKSAPNHDIFLVLPQKFLNVLWGLAFLEVTAHGRLTHMHSPLPQQVWSSPAWSWRAWSYFSLHGKLKKVFPSRS